MPSRGWAYGMGQVGFFALFLFLPFSRGVSAPSLETLNLPFEKCVIFDGALPGKNDERVVEGGKIDAGIACFRQSGKPDLIVPCEKVKAILPILPPNESVDSIEDLRLAIRSLQESRMKYPERPEVSDAILQQWQLRIDSILKNQEEARIKKQEDEEAKIRQAAKKRAEEELATKEAERSRQIEEARRKVANYQGFHSRQEIQEAVQVCEMLDKTDLRELPDYEKASEYWRRCLALPSDIAMPGDLEREKEPAMDLSIDPSSSGAALTALAWVLFLIPLLVILHGLTRFLALLQERAWIGALLWLGVEGAASLFLLFFSGARKCGGIGGAGRYGNTGLVGRFGECEGQGSHTFRGKNRDPLKNLSAGNHRESEKP